MSLLCGKNPALEALKSVQDSIKTALASKKAGLATLTAKLAEAKSKAESLVASLPNLSSFQAELAALAGATPEQIAQFKAKWDGKVAEIDSLISKATGAISGLANLDFCKDVPNVKMDPATGETVEEAKEAPTPNVAPAKAEPVEETVVVKSESVSSGESGVVPNDMAEKWKTLLVTPYRTRVRNPIQQKIEPARTEYLNTLKADRPRLADAGGDINRLTRMYQERDAQIVVLKNKYYAASELESIVDRYQKIYLEEIVNDASPRTGPELYALKTMSVVDPSYKSYMEDPLPWLNIVAGIIDQAGASTIKEFAAWKRNQS